MSRPSTPPREDLHQYPQRPLNAVPRSPTLMYRRGDRVQTYRQEVGTVVSSAGNSLSIALENGRLIAASVFDVFLLEAGRDAEKN